MKILKLNLNNYKSFRSSGWLDFSPNFTVVIGKNNAGKSALLEAFRLTNNPNCPHRMLSRPPDTLHPQSFLDFELTITGEELRNAVLAQTDTISIPVPTTPPDSRERFALDLFEKQSVTLALKANFAGGVSAWKYPSHGLFEFERIERSCCTNSRRSQHAQSSNRRFWGVAHKMVCPA